MTKSIYLTVDSPRDDDLSIQEFSIEENISDRDINIFGLKDADLKSAVRSYHGKKPQDVFLRSPTPWGDMYKRYNWEPVTRTVKAVSASVSTFKMKPVIVKTERIINTSSKPLKYHSSVSEEVTETVSSTWSKGGNFDVGTDIDYFVKVLNGKASFKYSNQWGRNKVVSKSHTLKSLSGLDIELQPGEGVLIKLTASRAVMKVKIDYEASLNGGVAVNYDPKYKGYSFSWFPIEKVMDSDGISNCIESSETIEISFYSNTNVEVEDL